MPWPLGNAEIIERMRRAYEIRGALPLELDENVVPVAVVHQATGIEFSGPAPFYFGAGLVAGPVVGEFPHVGLRCEAGRCVIDWALISGNNSDVFAQFRHEGPLSLAVSPNVVCNLSVPVTAALVQRPPISAIQDTDVAQQGLVGNRVGISRMLSATTVLIPINVLLNAGEAWWVRNQSVNVELMATVRGRWYPS